MLANQSIRYMTRENIGGDSGQEATVGELRAFLKRLVMGQCKDFNVVTRYTSSDNPSESMAKFIISLDRLIDEGCGDFPANETSLGLGEITHYTLNGHNRTITLD